MATINSGLLPRLHQEGLDKIFGNTYDQLGRLYPKYFEILKSGKLFEVQAQVEPLSAATLKNSSANIDFDSFAQGITPKYANLVYAKGVETSKETVRDELYDQIDKIPVRIATSLSQIEDITAADVLNNGFDSSFLMTDGDGVELFSTAHVNGPTDGGTYANKATVDASFSETAVEDLVTLIGNMTDSRGNQIALRPTQALGPTDLQFEFERVFRSQLRPDTADNDINAMKSMRLFDGNYEIIDYLSDVNAWFIQNTAPSGLTFYRREMPEFEMDNVFTNSNMRHKGETRFAVGWSDAHAIVGSSGS